MSPEWISAIAAIATMVVIAASALAALAQLRHMRGSNQIVALTECREMLESPSFREAMRFVLYDLPERLADPKERARIVEARSEFDPEYGAILIVANFFENLGVFVKNGIIDSALACDLWSFVIVRQWNALAPYITFARDDLRTPALWENFEYVAWISQRYLDAHPDGDYPSGAHRMPPDRSLVDAVKGPSTQ